MFTFDDNLTVTIKDYKITIYFSQDVTLDGAYIQSAHYGLVIRDYKTGSDFTVALDDNAMFYFSFKDGDILNYKIIDTTIYFWKN